MPSKPDLHIFRGDGTTVQGEPKPVLISSLDIGYLKLRIADLARCGTVELQRFMGNTSLVQISLLEKALGNQRWRQEFVKGINKINVEIEGGFPLPDSGNEDQLVTANIKGDRAHMRSKAWEALTLVVRNASKARVDVEPSEYLQLENA